MKSTGLRELWMERIDDYRASGERVASWCARHSVTTKQFYYWTRKLKTAEQAQPANPGTQWVSLLAGEPAHATKIPVAPHAVSALLITVGTASIEVKSGFDPALLMDVVKALKTVC